MYIIETDQVKIGEFADCNCDNKSRFYTSVQNSIVEILLIYFTN